MKKIPNSNTDLDFEAYPRFRAAVDIERAAFSVKRDCTSDEYPLYMLLGCFVFMSIILMAAFGSKGLAVYIAAGAVDVAAAIAAVCVAVMFSRKKKHAYVTYYIRSGADETCVSRDGARLVVYKNGQVSVKDEKGEYVLDGTGYLDWVDGECAGLVALRAAEERDLVYCPDDNSFFLETENGGSHTLFLDANDKILRIESVQPTRIIDGAGKARTKNIKYIKTYIGCDIPEDII